MNREVFIRIGKDAWDAKRIWREVAKARRLNAPDAKPTINFMSMRQYRRTLSEQRDRLLTTVARKRPHSIYHLAKLLGRPQSAVQQDVVLLSLLGLLRLERGVVNGRHVRRPVLTYNRIHFIRDFRAEGDRAAARPKRPVAVTSARPAKT